MVLIVVIMLVAVGATGLCTFNPGKPEQGPVQEVDARTFLDMEARSVNFPVVYPEAPAGWVTNSARRAMIEQAPAPTVGWVTADGGYLQLTQTGAPLDKAVRGADQKPRELQRSVDVGGTEAQCTPLRPTTCATCGPSTPGSRGSSSRAPAPRRSSAR